MAIYINGTKANNGFAVSSGSGGPTSADQVSYDNTTSGLTATDVQDAIDEVVENKADRVPLPAEYDATSTYNRGDLVVYNDVIYVCKSTISTPEAWDDTHWLNLNTTYDTDYLHSINPTGIGTFSLNRKASTTIGLYSFTEGYDTTSSGFSSHAEGYSTAAGAVGSHAEGYFTEATGSSGAHAEGNFTTASGNNSHAEGQDTTASEDASHAEGYHTTASGKSSHAEGTYTTANHKSQHVFGEYNVLDDSTTQSTAKGNYVEIVGNGTANNSRANARTLDWSGNEVLAGGLKINGTQDVAIKPASPPEYDPTSTYNQGDFCTHEGSIYISLNTISTPEAWNSYNWQLCTSQQDYLHSRNPAGNGSFSLNRNPGSTVGILSFAEGNNTIASGAYSHAEGAGSTASGTGAHAEGTASASGDYSHSEGFGANASGGNSHAEGGFTVASGNYSHAEGYFTTANHKSQHTFGEYNIVDTSSAGIMRRGNYVEIVGNGTGSSARSNARTLDWSGNEVLAGGLKINSTQDVATQVSLTQAEYDALVSAGTVDLVNTIYFITDADAVACSAAEVTYSNTTSGMLATNVQDAIDEVADVKGKVTQINKTDNATYSLLLATDNTTTTATGNAYKSSFLKYNPSTEILSLSSSGTPSINSIVLNPSSGGYISVNNVSTIHPSSASMSADSGGGHIWVTTPDGMGCVNLGGTSTGGVVKVTDQNRAEKIVLTGSTGAISCNSINGRTWFPYWSSKKTTYSNTSVTFTTSATVSDSNFIWIVGDANGNPIFSILAVHTTIRPATLKNLAYNISVAVDSSGSSMTISAPQWSTIQLVSDIPWR